MKRKFLTIVLALLTALCLAAGVAACAPKSDDALFDDTEPTLTVGTSVKELADVPFKGVTASANFGLYNLKGDYVGENFDYKERNITPDRFVNTYLRDGVWFTQENIGNVDATTPWEEAEFAPLTYTADLENHVKPNSRLAAYGFALMLSVKENSIINQNLKYQEMIDRNANAEFYASMIKEIPENGVWTGEVDLSGYLDFENFYTESLRECKSIADLVDRMSFFKYATAPFTQEQFIELLTGLSEFNLGPSDYNSLRGFSRSILAAGKPASGQSAFDYFRGAWKKMYEGMDEAAFEALKDECPDDFASEVGEMDFGTYIRACCDWIRSIWGELPKAAVAWSIGESTTANAGDLCLYFDEQGTLTGVKSYSNRGSSMETVIDDILFTAEAPELEDIDDTEIVYVEQGFSFDTVTCEGDGGWTAKFTLGGDNRAKTIRSLDFFSIEGYNVAAKLGAFEKDGNGMKAPIEITVDGKTANGNLTYYWTHDRSIDWNIYLTYADMCELFGEEADPDIMPPESEMTLLGGKIGTDTAVTYHGTISEFVQKPLSEITHWDTKPFDVFTDAIHELRGDSVYIDGDDYAYYVGGEKIAELSCYHDSGEIARLNLSCYKTLFDEPWAPNSFLSFRQEEDGIWAYKYSSNAGWSASSRLCKMKIGIPRLFTDYKYYLFNLSEDEYYRNVRVANGEAVFELNGIMHHFDLSTADCTFELDGISVTGKNERTSYIPDYTWSAAMEVSDKNKPDGEGWQKAMDRTAEPDSVTLTRDGDVLELDFLNKKAYYCGIYYAVQDGVLKQFSSYDGGSTWETEDTECTEAEIFYYPLKALIGVSYDAFTYDAFDDMFYIGIEDRLYGIHLAGWAGSEPRVDFVAVLEPDSNGRVYYEISKIDSTVVDLPQMSVGSEGVEEALARSLAATSYEAELTVSFNDLVSKEKFDFIHQITEATLTNTAGESPFRCLRAASEGKCWLYSDASGAWLRAETEGDTSTYVSDMNELLAIKRALDKLRENGSYTIPYDSATGVYTIGEFAVTVENGYIASYRRGEDDAVIVATFSNYNNVSLTLPATGTEDVAAKNAFVTALRNTAAAANFHTEWTIEDTINGMDREMVYASDIIAGQKAFSRVNMVLDTGAAMGKVTIPAAELYREVSAGPLLVVKIWQRDNTMSSPSLDQVTWGSWHEAGTSSADPFMLRLDMYLQNCVYAALEEKDPSLLWIAAKYDAATGTYTMRDFNVVTMSVVVNTFKIEGDYVTEWTTQNRDWLEGLGIPGDSLTFRYSNFGSTEVTKPTGIS